VRCCYVELRSAQWLRGAKDLAHDNLKLKILHQIE